MACYHFSVKPVSRSGGRSVCAASAYRAGERVYDPRAEIEHDYARKQGVEHSEIIGFDGTRQELWGQTEQIETRKNARLAVEAEIALPAELSADQRRELVREFGAELAREYGVAVDVAIHAPHRDGDERNHHAHVLVGCRKVEGDRLTDRVVPFDGPEQVERWRERWAEMQNRALEHAHQIERVDHRSNERQGIEAEPTRHLGPQATAAERAAKREAVEQRRPYGPITEQGQHNEAARAANERRLLEQARELVQRQLEKAQRLYEQAREHTQKMLERAGFRMEKNKSQIEIEKSARGHEPEATQRTDSAKHDAFRERLRQAGEKVAQQDHQKELEHQRQIERQHDRGISL